MSNNRKAVAVHSLQDLPQAMAGKGVVDSKGGKGGKKSLVPTLAAPTNLLRSEEIVALRADVSAQIENINQFVPLLGAAIGDDGHLTYSPEDVKAYEVGLLDFVGKTENIRAKDEFIVAIVAAMIASFPQTGAGLNHIADFGLQSGFFTEVAPSATGQQNVVVLPATKADGKGWEAKYLTSSKPNSHALIHQLQEISAAVSTRKAEANRESAAKLYEDAGNLLDVLAEGKGEATFRSPDKNVGDGETARVYRGGTVRIRVEDRKIYAVDAVGACAKRTKDIAAAGVFIPLAAVASDDLRKALNGKRIEDKGQWTNMLILHGLVVRGMDFEREQQVARVAKKAMQARQTVLPQDAVLNRTPGFTFLFMSKGWVVGGQGPNSRAQAYRNVYFLLEIREDGALRVADCGKHLEGLFAGCREFMAADDRFNGVRYPLAQMLKTLYGVFRGKAQKPADAAFEAEMLAAAGESTTADTDAASSPAPAVTEAAAAE